MPSVARLRTPCPLCGGAQDLMQLLVWGTDARASWVCTVCPYIGALLWNLAFDPGNY